VSAVLEAVLNAIALESQRVREFAQDATEQSVPSLIEEQLTLVATPGYQGVVDATNMVTDPEGKGALTAWEVSNGTKGTTETGLPQRFTRAVTNTSNAGGTQELRALVTIPTAGTYYWYVLAKTTYTANVVYIRLRQHFGAFSVIGASQLIGTGMGSEWQLFGGAATIASTGVHRIEAASQGTPAAGTVIYMTGATLVAGADPGEVFTGDFGTTGQHAYAWQGARHASPSLRHSQAFDLLDLQEREREFSIHPEGMSFASRKAYLQHRMHARHKPYATEFVDLIVKVIQSEVPGFSASSVRIDEDYDSYTFSVNIAYAEQGALSERIEQLVNDIKPAHLKLTGITWGQFLADVNEAGDPV
jgi:hypothetical protein